MEAPAEYITADPPAQLTADLPEQLTAAIVEALQTDQTIAAALVALGLDCNPRAAQHAAEAALIALVAYNLGQMDERSSKAARTQRRFTLMQEDHANAAAGHMLKDWPSTDRHKKPDSRPLEHGR